MDIMRLKTEGDNRIFSQELRFSSPDNDSPFKWLAGLYYFDEKKDLGADMIMRQPTPIAPGLSLPPFDYIQNSTTDVTGYAAFGQASYLFFEKLNVTLGLRFDHEEKEFKLNQYYNPDLSMLGRAPVTANDDASWNEILPRIAVDYTFQPGLMAYASVSRGYKSGGFNSLGNATTQISYDPEYTTNYEIGLKTSWADDRLVINLAMFHIDWTDQQVEMQIYPDSVTTNAGESTSQGVELEVLASPLRGLMFNLGFGYTHAEFDEYKDDVFNSSGQKVGEVDYAGKRIPGVPAYNVNLGAQYRHDCGLFLRATISGVGDFYWDSANTQKEDAYITADAKVGWEWEHFQVYLWGKNVFYTNYATRAFDMGGTWYGRAGDPTTFGITLQGQF